MFGRFWAKVRGEEGQNVSEYAVILVLLLLIVVATVHAIGMNAQQVINRGEYRAARLAALSISDSLRFRSPKSKARIGCSIIASGHPSWVGDPARQLLWLQVVSIVGALQCLPLRLG